MRKELRNNATGEPLPIVQMICKAKLIDQELFLESKFNTLQQEIEATKSLGPVAQAMAKANFEIYQKKRFQAIQLIWDFQHNEKKEFNEFKGLVNNQSNSSSMRRSLRLQQNPGHLPFSKTHTSSQDVHENEIRGNFHKSMQARESKMKSSSKINWQSHDIGKDMAIENANTPITRQRTFNLSKKTSIIRSTNNIDVNPLTPPSRFGGNSQQLKDHFGRHSTGYSRFYRKDSINLPHNKLPEIAPVIPIEDSVKYRFTNAKFQNLTSNGLTRQEQFINGRQNVARNTIEQFKKFLNKNQSIRKAQQTARQDRDDIHVAKFAEIAVRRNTNKMRNSEYLRGWMDKSIQDFKDLQIETHERIQKVLSQTQARSRSHQSSIKTDRLQQEHKRREEKKKIEQYIVPRLKKCARDQLENEKRAQSARSATISRLEQRSQQVNNIVQNINERKIQSSIDQFTKNVADRTKSAQKIRQQGERLDEQREQISERLLLGRQRFKESDERSQDLREKSNKKVQDYHDRIDRQVSERNLRQEERSIFMKCESESRTGNNAQNYGVKMQQLESIKERVKRKFIKTLQRRQMQLKTFAPPTTFEIYMNNYDMKSRTQANFNTQVQKLENKLPAADGAVVKQAQPVSSTPQNYKMPHSDFSFRMALFSSQHDLTKKKVKKPL